MSLYTWELFTLGLLMAIPNLIFLALFRSSSEVHWVARSLRLKAVAIAVTGLRLMAVVLTTPPNLRLSFGNKLFSIATVALIVVAAWTHLLTYLGARKPMNY